MARGFPDCAKDKPHQTPLFYRNNLLIKPLLIPFSSLSYVNTCLFFLPFFLSSFLLFSPAVWPDESSADVPNLLLPPLKPVVVFCKLVKVGECFIVRIFAVWRDSTCDDHPVYAVKVIVHLGPFYAASLVNRLRLVERYIYVYIRAFLLDARSCIKIEIYR